MRFQYYLLFLISHLVVGRMQLTLLRRHIYLYAWGEKLSCLFVLLILFVFNGLITKKKTTVHTEKQKKHTKQMQCIVRLILFGVKSVAKHFNFNMFKSNLEYVQNWNRTKHKKTNTWKKKSKESYWHSTIDKERFYASDVRRVAFTHRKYDKNHVIIAYHNYMDCCHSCPCDSDCID